MPLPRQGCQTCRIRRIKCDETKPVCQRCVKSRRVCLDSSAVKQAHFSIHLENPYASGETKRPRGPRPRSNLSLFRPTSDVLSSALGYYLNYYLYEVVDLPTISACMSECLITWQISKRECCMVDLAISAVALAIFSRTQQYPIAAKKASLQYGRLLRIAQNQITQKKILKLDNRGFDEFILAIVLMAWYETTMHQPAGFRLSDMSRSFHSWSHHDGAIAILKVWTERHSENTPSSIIKQGRRGLLRSALLRNHSLPDWIQEGGRFGERGLDQGFDTILVRVVNLRHAFMNLEEKQGLHVKQAQDLCTEALDLDQVCRVWAHQVPCEWSYKSHDIPTSWSRAEFYSPTILICERNCYLAVWMQYFAVQMLIKGILLGLLQGNHLCELRNSDTTYKQEIQMYSLQLKAMTNSLISAVPFSLGRIRVKKMKASDSSPVLTLNINENIPPALALPIIWPLTVASGLSGIELSQRLWFRAKLASLGRILGDGALQCAETDQWTHT